MEGHPGGGTWMDGNDRFQRTEVWDIYRQGQEFAKRRNVIAFINK